MALPWSAAGSATTAGRRQPCRRAPRRDRKRRLPDPARIIAAAADRACRHRKRPARQRIAHDVEIIAQRSRALGAIEAEGCKRRRVAAGADAEFKTAVRQQIEDGRVLGYPDRIFQRQRDDAGAEPDARGLRRDEAEKCERRRKATFRLVKMVLRDPRGIETRRLRVPDLLRGQAISFRRRGVIEKPREKPQPLQICKTFHEGLRR